MKTNLQLLFEDYKGMRPEQEKCQQLLKEIGFDGYSLYMRAHTLTIEDLKAEHKYPTRNIFATTFNAFVIGLAQDRYPEWIRMSDDRRVNRIYLEPAPGFHIYLKQLYGKNSLPSNIGTLNVKLINTNQLFDRQVGLINVLYVGAVMDAKDKYQINEIRASYVNRADKNDQWSLNMIDFVQTSTISLPRKQKNDQENEQSLIIGKPGTQKVSATGSDTGV